MQRRLLLTSLGGSLLASFAMTARADDDGDFIILHARYGTEYSHVDVTGRLKELARQDRRFRLENDVMGVDPAPERVKTLRIFARDRQGRERTFEYREHDWVDGNQFIGWGGGRWGDDDGPRGWHGGGGRREDDGEFTILYATYGTDRREVDVTERLREFARRDQRLRMGNETFGIDPDPGRVKRLRIVARDRSGRERNFDYREDAVVDGSLFIGWGRGDWGSPRPQPSRLFIESARYGSGRRSADVTQALRSRVRGGRLDGEATNEWLGVDPAPGDRKALTVTYRVGDGRSSTVRFGEGASLRLP
jgi:hypothetical protein